MQLRMICFIILYFRNSISSALCPWASTNQVKFLDGDATTNLWKQLLIPTEKKGNCTFGVSLIKINISSDTGHYNDAIMGRMASIITTVSIVYSTVCSDADKNIKAPRYWPLWGEFTGEFPAQRPVTQKNVSNWWRHHKSGLFCDSYAMIPIAIVLVMQDLRILHSWRRISTTSDILLKWYIVQIHYMFRFLK